MVRNGYLPARTIMTGAGPLDVEQPRVGDKTKDMDDRIAFSSAILPPYLRKSRSVEELIPWLYLKRGSTEDSPEALQSLIGSDAKGFSPNVVVRLKETWGKEYDDWNRRDLSREERVYAWADGIRESKQSWVELLLDLKQRGLTKPPRLAVGDGALGPPAHHEPNREHLRDDPTHVSTHEGKRLEEGQPDDDVQARSVSQQALATTQRPSPDRSCSRRKNLHRRSTAERRLIQNPGTQLLTITTTQGPIHRLGEPDGVPIILPCSQAGTSLSSGPTALSDAPCAGFCTPPVLA